MLKKVLIGVAVVVVLFLALVATRPDSYQVTRSAQISAPAEVVFGEVADFHRWDAWSPWAKLDPAMKTTYQGPTAAPGSIYAWSGNDKVGEGRMTIVEAVPGERVAIKLEFIRPFAGLSDTTFTFVPRGNATETTWTMVGHNNFAGKALCLFMNMDKMVGGDFERGLARLKTVSEARGSAVPAASR
jgi:hypothetical protein